MCEIGVEGAEYVADSIRDKDLLTDLCIILQIDIGNNKITLEGSEAIMYPLRHKQRLQVLCNLKIQA